MIPLAAQMIRPGLYVGPAFPRDAASIADLLASAQGSCVPLSEAEILARLSAYEVVRSASGRVVGCASIHQVHPPAEDASLDPSLDPGDRAELRAVVVDPAWRGSGVGRLLTSRAVCRAEDAGHDLFCVSRTPRFFESFGFRRLPASDVPQRAGVAADGPPRVALLHEAPESQEDAA